MTHDPLCPARDNDSLPLAVQIWQVDCQCDLIGKIRADQQPTDYETWIAIGVGHGWVSKPTCSTHEVMPHTPEEEADWDEGLDPCIPVVRIWTDAIAAS